MKPYKVICIGLHRTGTASLAQALRMLGYKTLHCFYCKRDVYNYDPARGERSRALPQDLVNADAFGDINAAATFPTLDLLYPNSKFIYTVREVNSWVNSIAAYLYSYGVLYEDSPKPQFVPFDINKNLNDKAMAIYYMEAYGEMPPKEFDRDWWVTAYIRHDKRVAKYFTDRPKDILVWNLVADPNWAPLCRFLKEPVPKQAFPQTSETFGRPWKTGKIPRFKGILDDK